jgi:hypothetical protein
VQFISAAYRLSEPSDIEDFDPVPIGLNERVEPEPRAAPRPPSFKGMTRAQARAQAIRWKLDNPDAPLTPELRDLIGDLCERDDSPDDEVGL